MVMMNFQFLFLDCELHHHYLGAPKMYLGKKTMLKKFDKTRK